MKKLILFTICCCGFAQMNFAQTTKQASVEIIFTIGTYNLVVLKENNTTIYYKSDLTSFGGSLVQNQQVTITYENNSNDVVSFFDSNNNKIFCSLMVGETNPSTAEILDLNSITIENGVLFFDDKQHLEDTHLAIINLLDGSDTSVIELEIFEEIEDEFSGYKSFREEFNEIHKNENGLYSNSELEYMFKRDFVIDEFEKTFLNQDRLIGIGDDIYYYHSLNNYIIFDKSEDTLKDLFKQIDQNFDLYTLDYNYEKYDSLYDDDSPLDTVIEQTFITLFRDQVFEIHNPMVTNVSVVNKATTYDEDSIYRIKTTVNTLTPDCSAKTRAINVTAEHQKIVNDLFTYDPSNEKGTLTIDWGDGSTPEVITNYNPYAGGVWIYHSYPAGSTVWYYPTTELEIEDEGGSTHILEDGNNTDGEDILLHTGSSCTDVEVIKDTNQISGDWRMYSSITVKHTLGNKVIGVTKSYHKVGNAWEEHKSDLYVKVEGVFRNEDCIDPHTRNGDKSRNLRKEISKTKTKYRDFYNISNNEVWSEHTLEKGSLTLYKKHILIPCP